MTSDKISQQLRFSQYPGKSQAARDLSPTMVNREFTENSLNLDCFSSEIGLTGEVRGFML
jgi:hypothetical protein